MTYGHLSRGFQGDYKRVLCVCSAGMLRSPTIAHTLSAEPFNYNTRVAGTANYALTPVTDDLLQWADEIVCVDDEHALYIRNRLMDLGAWYEPVIIDLKIPDDFPYRDPKLVKLIRERYSAIQKEISHE